MIHYRTMQLSLENRTIDDVVVIRCHGRVVSGEEASHLQAEIGRLTALTKNVVLNLAEVTYVDSGGLGSLVRIYGVLRAARGDLKICQLSPFVEQVLEATNLLKVFQPVASEAEALGAFSRRPASPQESPQPSTTRIVCLDTSLDVLAYLKVLLQRSGYEVFTTRYLSDAVSLALGTRPSLLVCGPSWHGNDAAGEKFRQSAPSVRLLHLPADFSTSEAEQAGRNLVDRVQALLTA
jgi:anti-anti-sigma factor